MVMTDAAVESSSTIPKHSRRMTPEEIEGFQGVVLDPGGEVGVLNVSNSGILVETRAHTKPGYAVQVNIAIADVDHVIEARIVRSEVKSVGQGLRYELAIAFDETQHLFGRDDAPVVDTPTPRGDELVSANPPDEAHVGLPHARSLNRW